MVKHRIPTRVDHEGELPDHTVKTVLKQNHSTQSLHHSNSSFQKTQLRFLHSVHVNLKYDLPVTVLVSGI